jgi:hypothetical protein
MVQKLSDLYDANFKKVRGKSAEGFIRPTVGEYFVTHKDFTEIHKQNSNVDLSKFNNVIYVDSVNGNDLTGNGDENNPYYSLNHAINTANTGDAIRLLDGVYTIYQAVDLFTYKNLSYIGNEIKTEIVIQNTQLNASLDSKQAYFYKLVFKASDTLTGDTRSIMYFEASDNKIVRFNNVGFKLSDNGNYPTNWMIIWDNTSSTYTCSVKLFNCSALCGNIENFSANGYQIEYTNFASDKDTRDGTNFTTSLFDAVLNDDFSISSYGWENSGTGDNPDGTQAHIGVYGGIYAWSKR